MIITMRHARRLLIALEADYVDSDEEGSIVNHEGKQYVAIRRFGSEKIPQRIDHYLYVALKKPGPAKGSHHKCKK